MTDQSKLSPSERAFIDAAKNGDAKRIREALASGVPEDLRDDWNMPWDQTALMYAARGGHLESVQVLLKAGASVSAKDKNARDSMGENQPLHHAMASRNPAVIEELISAGADVNALNMFGDTPLNRAIEENNLEAARLLLKRGATVNLKSKRRCRPPLCAASWAQIPPPAIRDFILLLLEAGADPNAVDNLGRTALYALVTARDIPNEIAVPLLEKLLQTGAKSDCVDKEGDTPLLHAVMYWNPPAVKLLVQAGADTARIYGRGTVLDIAEIDTANQEKQLANLNASKATASGEMVNQLNNVVAIAEDKVRRCKEVAKFLQDAGAKRKAEIS